GRASWVGVEKQMWGLMGPLLDPVFAPRWELNIAGEPGILAPDAMNETRALARFVVETTPTDLPRRLVENLKITVLDTFAAALVGTRQPWAQRIVAVVRAQGGSPEASVIHHGWRTDVARAALANGVLIGAFEC